MKFTIPPVLRTLGPSSLVSAIMHTESKSYHRFARRDLAPGSLAILVIFPLVAVLTIVGITVTFVLRRRRRRKLHSNSPTTSAIRNSLEEDIESYRRERERMGDVMGAGMSQDDLEYQLRGAAGVGSARDSIISMTSASLPASRSASRHRRSEIEGWYTPPAAPHSPRNGSRHSGGPGPNGGGNGNGSGKRRGRAPPGSRGPSVPGSRAVSSLRNSIQQVDEGVDETEKRTEDSATKIEQIDETNGGTEKDLRGFYEPEVKDPTAPGSNFRGFYEPEPRSVTPLSNDPARQ